MSIEFTQTSHCTWQFRLYTVVQEYCPNEGGVVFRLHYCGRRVGNHKTLLDAKQAAYARLVNEGLLHV